MRRREFIKLIAGLVIACPLATSAQQAAKTPIIGFLGSGTPETNGLWRAAFIQRLHELGWVEGQNLTIEYRWADGSVDRAAEFAAEFVHNKVDVIVTYANPVIEAAKRATSRIPIIFAAAADPLGTGLVASLARPGGNVTGLSIQHTDLASKRLEILREVTPRLRRLAVIVNADNPASMLDMKQAEAAAHAFNLEIATVNIQRADDIAPALKEIDGHADALYVCIDTVLFSNRTHITTFALAAHLPTMLSNREYVEAGGLMSYSANFPDLFRRAGDYVDKVLRGAKPAEIPVEQPTRFDLIINLTTAKALKLSVPLSLLATADEVIE
jgi:putative tryptophan/tyrosine transport system substrate-binding protein